jgi:hypothetical protein
MIYAFVDANGEIRNLMDVAPSAAQYELGSTVDGLTVVDGSTLDVDMGEAVETKYWKDGAWETRSLRPQGDLSYWDSAAEMWRLDNVKLQSYIRQVRNDKLTECDWTQMPDAPLTQAKKDEWITYRQELRDLPALYENATDFTSVVWPTAPSS